MSTKSPLTRICIHCGAEFTRRSPFGRPPEYCTDAHRSAAFRDRVSRAAPVVPPEHDAAVVRISESAVRRSQQLQRRTRTFDSLQRLEALKLYVALVQDIEDLGAVMARQARAYGASWKAIGDVLHISGDSARSRWSPGRVERVLEKRAKRGSSPRARRSAGDGADQGGPPGPAMAQALTDLQRGSGKSVRALARVINYSPSYVSRLLNGERRPSWEIAEKLILACDGDPEPIRPLWNRVNRGCGGGSSSQHDDLTEAATLMQNALQQMDPAAGPFTGLTREGTDKPPTGRHITSFTWPVAGTQVAVVQGGPDEVRAVWDRLSTDGADRFPPAPLGGQKPPPGSQESSPA